MSQLPPDLRARILEGVRREPSPTMADRRRGVSAVAAVGILASLALFVRLGTASGRPPLVLLAVGIGGGLSALVATWAGGSRGASMLGRSRATLAVVAVLAPLVLLASALAGAGLQGDLALTGGTAFEHLKCFLVTMLLALGPFAALAYARRGTDPVHPRALGAAIGAAAGAWGGALIDLHCALTSVEHLGLAHALPIALLAAIGALLGGRLLGLSPGRRP